MNQRHNGRGRLTRLRCKRFECCADGQITRASFNSDAGIARECQLVTNHHRPIVETKFNGNTSRQGEWHLARAARELRVCTKGHTRRGRHDTNQTMRVLCGHLHKGSATKRTVIAHGDHVTRPNRLVCDRIVLS